MSILLSNTPKVTSNKFCNIAAGCFWGTERYMKKEFGDKIIDGHVGYSGGDEKQYPNPSYKQVCSGNTGHAEAYRFEYDPQKVKYADLIEHFFRFHDPTTLNKQGNDTGSQYRSAIFYYDDEQKEIAEQVLEKVQKERYGSPFRKIVTQIAPAQNFYRAEDYHQQYLDLNPGGYCNHRYRW
ncbi:hypothetical protein MP228_010012 [Amoeboaphelidium protococcarum]|nr:hypothetical protein MP228_010012 [Amoeboaphelidium protococcarum]